MRIKRSIISMAFLLSMLLCSSQNVLAANFDPTFYATRYPDVVSVLGNNTDALYDHYLTYGMKEGRFPYAGAAPGEKVDGIKAGSASDVNSTGNSTGYTPVPINKLANYKSIKKKMSDDEFQQAYNAALAIVTPLAEMSREEQLLGIAVALREMFESGQVSYSTEEAHYNDPYGYLVLGVASCAGCARTTGLCLNILGIPYEHVNEDQWSHQWCRVDIDGTYWICDAYGLYVGPEPEPYAHPYL